MERTKRPITPVQGIALDLEGTIIDIEALHHTAHLRAAADAGVSLSWEEALERAPHFVGGPDEEVAAEIASLADERVSTQEILLAKRLHFGELLQEHSSIAPREGFIEFVRWARRLGLEVAIGTVTNRALAMHLLERADLLPEFNDVVVIAREDVLAPKPSPDVYYETARRIGIAPSSQLVFEDSIVGIISARSAGCRLVAIPTIHIPSFLQSLYREGAEAVFMTWSDPDIRSFILRGIGA
jgi:HAD superfamily hydrolase (TIGR01509 family)